VEEAIHLAGTFLAAGFQNVIASLWKVSDRSSAEVAELVYQNIVKMPIRSDSIALALHRALLELRSRDIADSGVLDYENSAREFGPDESNSKPDAPYSSRNSPYSWMSYIHMGYQT
jgi:CHAT domain-containing protein